jgi:peptidoglycan/LPS O-acetylase OafA/YrhL
VAALLLLWLATGYALFLAIGALLSMSRDPDAFADPARTAWIMVGLAALALGHLALNVAFARHRNWARLGTEALMSAYAIALVAYAATAPARDGEQPWALLLLLALVPLAFVWALRSHECKDWCGRNGNRGERHGHDEQGDGPRPGGT